ncbi:hypothetical protein SSP531S_49080 [Streptomyces spongiicola]|uniref:Uncharacterized protein n=1 Tax=Streptomyces spongiicola TaxID=1690221 RepID=A0A388T3C5_9ACTN|nr:hypothetical protein SSP531S_49080 [Streptomyces spongiicola]
MCPHDMCRHDMCPHEVLTHVVAAYGSVAHVVRAITTCAATALGAGPADSPCPSASRTPVDRRWYAGRGTDGTQVDRREVAGRPPVVEPARGPTTGRPGTGDRRPATA